MTESILKEGLNVWKICRAAQALPLIDAAEYYESLAQNLERAERHLFILGWDIDSRLELTPGRGDPGLAARLSDLVVRRPGLHVYLLLWDFSSIYLLDREAFQSIKLGLASHPRIHFRFDAQHPVWGSHHQKVVVIDDMLAYCGGIDLTGYRWDTTRHEARDPRRTSPTGKAYPPFHDCQMAVTGEPAGWLGQLCRERWFRATGQLLVPPPASTGPAAAFNLPGDVLTDVPLGIARTVPVFQDQPQVREAECLFADMIDAAQRYLYIENQYFTSQLICRKLGAALGRADGPEVVLVLPKAQDSLLAKLTMGTLSMRCLAAMQTADRYGRFHAYFPEDERLAGDEYVNVHAKVMIVDDLYLRIGSANMNNRSMGLDTEGDLVLDATGGVAFQDAVRCLLARLLADHTGTLPAEAVAALTASGGSLSRAIDALNGRSPKTLQRFTPPERAKSLGELIASIEVIDPDQSHPVEQLVDDFVFGPKPATAVNLPRHVPAGLFLTFAFCLTIASTLALAPLFGNVHELTLGLAGSPPAYSVSASLAVLLAYVIGGFTCIPLNLLIVATASVLPTWSAMGHIVAGSLLGAGAGYVGGRLVGRPLLRRFFPRQEALIRATVGQRNLAAMLLVRFFPIAPFALVNLVAGTLKLRLAPYFAGTFLGMLPGAVSLVFFQKSLLQLLARPSLGRLCVFVLVTLVITRAFSFLSRRFSRLADGPGYA